ncbi:unnamed protein product [Prorocentrum cordatum]|uniref:C3H1-type domain-containing protein n=1 Tax=Prorocentrum cordatum TaxID=2364126 RepID=A0ABN9S5J4_9DINO|nr:unnamed protein product [Polarella glacialis]
MAPLRCNLASAPARHRLGGVAGKEGREKIVWKATFIDVDFEVGNDERQGSLSPRPCSEPCSESSSCRSAFFDADRMRAAALSKRMDEAWASNSRETMRKLLFAGPSVDSLGQAREAGGTRQTATPCGDLAMAPARHRPGGPADREGLEKIKWKATFIDVGNDERQGSLSPRPSSEPCSEWSSYRSDFFDADRLSTAALSKRMDEAWASNSREAMKDSLEKRRLSAAADAIHSPPEQLSSFMRTKSESLADGVVAADPPGKLPEIVRKLSGSRVTEEKEAMRVNPSATVQRPARPALDGQESATQLWAMPDKPEQVTREAVGQAAGTLGCVEGGGADGALADPCGRWQASPAPGAGCAHHFNPGSLGHPEMCVRPCLYFLQGQCTSGSECRFCHCQHPTRPVHLGRSHRKTLEAATADECFAICLPILERKMISLRLATDTLQSLASQQGAVLGGSPIGTNSRAKSRGLQSLEKVFAALSMRTLLVVMHRKMAAHDSRQKTLLDALTQKLRETGFILELGEELRDHA